MTALKQKWDELKAENPRIRIRNAAEVLGVSEAELLVTQEGVVPLKPDFASILLEVEKLGKVMALTRNEACVHERKGIYLNGDFSNPHAQLFVGEDIDMRIFLSAWQYGFAVEEGDKKSLQFFGKDGLALHKIYLTKDSHIGAFQTLVSKFKNEPQHLEIVPVLQNSDEKPDEEIDTVGFHQDWRNLKDTHHFFSLLKKYGVSRTQALRLAPDQYFAKKIEKDLVVKAIEESAKRGFHIMVFVGNRGNIQIHTGPVQRTLWHGTWFNVMDPDFNLHLDVAKIEQSWIVRKPTDDGIVTSIEVFDKKGDIIVQLFGKRKPGLPEMPEWRDLVNLL